MSSRQKKRGSLSRVKSTPKEEGGGDNPELRHPSDKEESLVRTKQIMPPHPRAGKKNNAPQHSLQNNNISNYYSS